MSIQRREVFLVIKELANGKIVYVEGMKCASNYFFDGHSRVGIDPNGSSSFVEFIEGERPMQLFHMPSERSGQWQAAYHAFGCSPEIGDPTLEYIIFVGAYSNDRELTFKLMREGLDRAWDIVDGKRALRDGEFDN